MELRRRDRKAEVETGGKGCANAAIIRHAVTTTLMALSALTGLLVALGCSEDQLNFQAKEGERCQDCHACDGLTTGCVCKTCTDYAYDPGAKDLLSCGANRAWHKMVHCAGGGSVACTENRGYRFTCYGEDGGVVPVP